MPLHLITPGFPFDTTVAFETAVNANARSSCLQHAQEQISLCEPLFILGALFPVFVWPILPSTSEVINYRILGFSSLAQFVSTTSWAIYIITTDTDGTLRPLFYPRIWGFIIQSVLCCCVILGTVGHLADKSGKRLGRESFDLVAYATLNFLLSEARIIAEDLLGVSSVKLTIAWILLMVVLFIDRPRPVKTMYYHMTRRISSLHWLPQNGPRHSSIPGSRTYCASSGLATLFSWLTFRCVRYIWHTDASYSSDNNNLRVEKSSVKHLNKSSILSYPDFFLNLLLDSLLELLMGLSRSDTPAGLLLDSCLATVV